MFKAALAISAAAALCALTVAGKVEAQGTSPATPPATPPAQAAPAPTADVSGNYQCQPDPTPCLWSGQTPSISQSSTKLDVKNDKGEVAAGMLTSNITMSVGGPMNANGVVGSDHSIEWSNGNKWQKK
jgi:hypothetical protein